MLRFDWLRGEGCGNERRVSTWLLIFRHGDLRGRALKSKLLAQKSGAPCRMVSGRDVNSTQWVAEKNGTRKYPANACTRVLSLPFSGDGKREDEGDEPQKEEQYVQRRQTFPEDPTVGLITNELMNGRLSVNLCLWSSNNLRFARR